MLKKISHCFLYKAGSSPSSFRGLSKLPKCYGNTISVLIYCAEKGFLCSQILITSIFPLS